MFKKKKSFFEKLAGGINIHNDEEDDELDDLLTEEGESENSEKKEEEEKSSFDKASEDKQEQSWTSDEDGQLTVDMYQTPTDIVIQSMVAGVKPEDLDVSIAQDMITIKGKRQQSREVDKENYYYKELYWGNFSRSILLPHEIDSSKTKATSKDGLLILRLPKTNREKTQKIDIKVE